MFGGMSKVVIDMTMSLDGFVAGPEDGKEHPLGSHGGAHLFDWYFSGGEEYRDPLFRPAPGANRDEVERMYAESGAFIFGRRTYEIANGWDGRHPVNGAPTFVLTHSPPANYPRGPSNLTFVTDGIASAVRQARAVADGKDIKLGGASPASKRWPPACATRSWSTSRRICWAAASACSMRCPPASAWTSCP